MYRELVNLSLAGGSGPQEKHITFPVQVAGTNLALSGEAAPHAAVFKYTPAEVSLISPSGAVWDWKGAGHAGIAPKAEAAEIAENIIADAAGEWKATVKTGGGYAGASLNVEYLNPLVAASVPAAVSTQSAVFTPVTVPGSSASTLPVSAPTDVYIPPAVSAPNNTGVILADYSPNPPADKTSSSMLWLVLASIGVVGVVLSARRRRR